MTKISRASIGGAVFGVLACGAIATAQACGKNHYILENPLACDGAFVAPMHTARSGHTATVLPDGRVLVVGGNHDNQLTEPLGFGVRPASQDSVEIYDPATGAWQRAAPLIQARRFHTATLLRDGRVLVTGGESNFHWMALPGGNSEIYDPASNTWAQAAPILHTGAHSGSSATLLPDGRVLVIGGADVNDNFVRAQVYDPQANVWTLVEPAGPMRYIHSAAALPDGRVLVAAGVDDLFLMTSSRFADIYDPVTGRFIAASLAPSARAMHAATSLADGRLLLSGGWSSSFVVGAYGRFHTLASADLFDPATGQWSSLPDLFERRFGHTQTLLADGSVLVAGGMASIGAVPNLTYATLSSVELRLGGTGPSIPVGNLALGRRFHTATRLHDGSVLVVGGGGADGPATATVELIGARPATP